MFGQNEKVGRSYFKERAPNELVVTSSFFTLQGEGPFRGMPAYFVRVAKCNLSCSFCDTYFDSGDVMTFDEIFERATKDINKFFAEREMEVPVWATEFPRRMVLVMTGGEPSLQKNLEPFLEEAQQYFAFTQIESNGILPVDLPGTTVVVSPKCQEKDGYATKYLQPHPNTLKRADCLKFVISAPESEHFSPYADVPDWAKEWHSITGRQVFVSPMNMYNKEPQAAKELRAAKNDITIDDRSKVDEVISFWEPGLLDMEANQRNHEYTAELAMKHGFILNLQTHLYASLP